MLRTARPQIGGRRPATLANRCWLSLNGFLVPPGGACSKRRCTICLTPLRTERTGTPTGLQRVLDYAIGGIHLKARSFKYN
jgi:hypothetical protein